MTLAALRFVAVFAAVLTAAWAAVLALAEESPNVAKALVEADPGTDASVARYRMIHVSRLSLLLIAAVTASLAIGWWTRPPAQALGAVGIAVGFIYAGFNGIPLVAAGAVITLVGLYAWALEPATEPGTQ